MQGGKTQDTGQFHSQLDMRMPFPIGGATSRKKVWPGQTRRYLLWRARAHTRTERDKSR